MDLEVLIAEVFVRTPLWMVRHTLHHNRAATEKLWAEVANALDTTKDNAKYKWKYLKDNYRKQLKKVRQCTSGDVPSGSLKPSKWPYFELLYFLKDEVSSNETKGNLNRNDKNNAGPEKTQDPFEGTNWPMISEDNFEEGLRADVDPSTAFTAVAEILTSGSSSEHDSNHSTPKRRKRKRSTYAVTAKNRLLEEHNIKLFKREHNELYCEDYHFLMSLLPYFKPMEDVQKLRLRNKITQCIIEELLNNSGPTSQGLSTD